MSNPAPAVIAGLGRVAFAILSAVVLAALWTLRVWYGDGVSALGQGPVTVARLATVGRNALAADLAGIALVTINLFLVSARLRNAGQSRLVLIGLALPIVALAGIELALAIAKTPIEEQQRLLGMPARLLTQRMQMFLAALAWLWLVWMPSAEQGLRGGANATDNSGSVWAEAAIARIGDERKGGRAAAQLSGRPALRQTPTPATVTAAAATPGFGRRARLMRDVPERTT